MLLPAPAPQAGVSANSTTSPENRAQYVSITIQATPATNGTPTGPSERISGNSRLLGHLGTRKIKAGGEALRNLKRRDVCGSEPLGMG